MVAVRPEDASSSASTRASERASEIVEFLRRLTHRQDVAETIEWQAIGKVPGAASDVEFIVRSRPAR